MDRSELVAAAHRRARPCFLLKRTGPADSFAAIWGGEPIVAAPSAGYRHWLSIDCRFLSGQRRAGVMTVLTACDDCESGIVTFDAQETLTWSTGIRLFAHQAISLPPPDAMPFDEIERYLPIWQSNCPLYTGDADAILGGWHFPWPDGDWEDLRNETLLLWTLAESEPWIEVWQGTEGFRVTQRVT